MSSNWVYIVIDALKFNQILGTIDRVEIMIWRIHLLFASEVRVCLTLRVRLSYPVRYLPRNYWQNEVDESSLTNEAAVRVYCATADIDSR